MGTRIHISERNMKFLFLLSTFFYFMSISQAFFPFNVSLFPFCSTNSVAAVLVCSKKPWMNDYPFKIETVVATTKSEAETKTPFITPMKHQHDGPKSSASPITDF